MITSAEIKAAALKAGADLCGIGDLSRFDGAPKEMDPRELFPEARTVIGMVFRIPRGVQRGIEEGTQFYQYPSMAYGGINEIYAPAVLYRVGQLLEDAGYEAMVYRNTGARGCVSDMDGSPGNTLSPEEQIEVNTQAKSKTAHHRTVGRCVDDAEADDQQQYHHNPKALRAHDQNRAFLAECDEVGYIRGVCRIGHRYLGRCEYCLEGHRADRRNERPRRGIEERNGKDLSRLDDQGHDGSFGLREGDRSVGIAHGERGDGGQI